MPTPLLATQLYIPHIHPNLVLHPRIVNRLVEGLGSRGTPGVTLISVSAGFGKTIGFTDRSYQKAKRRTMNDEFSEVLAPHSSLQGDKT